MRARADNISFSAGAVQIRMDLREAFAVGTVLAGIEGEEPEARRCRDFGESLLVIGRGITHMQATEIAVALASADGRTASGKIARSLADVLAEVANEARVMPRGKGFGAWREIGTANGREETRIKEPAKAGTTCECEAGNAE